MDVLLECEEKPSVMCHTGLSLLCVCDATLGTARARVFPAQRSAGCRDVLSRGPAPPVRVLLGAQVTETTKGYRRQRALGVWEEIQPLVVGLPQTCWWRQCWGASSGTLGRGTAQAHEQVCSRCHCPPSPGSRKSLCFLVVNLAVCSLPAFTEDVFVVLLMLQNPPISSANISPCSGHKLPLSPMTFLKFLTLLDSSDQVRSHPGSYSLSSVSGALLSQNPHGSLQFIAPVICI